MSWVGLYSGRAGWGQIDPARRQPVPQLALERVAAAPVQLVDMVGYFVLAVTQFRKVKAASYPGARSS